MSLNNMYPFAPDGFLMPPFTGLTGYYPIQGLPQGAKPPPLTMLSPSASKISRNTATVPPLSQVSPSNGITTVSGNSALSATRTSSFAAALRKLATQAKDPEDMKHITPPSTGSPGSTASKRGPPPLVFTSQSTSALSSPPVVTIAPTQTHPSVMSSDRRQGIEQLHSTHGLGSASYDPLIYKQERDQRPLSSHSREDDRASSKDGSLLGPASARIVTPQSTPIPTTPLSHHEDSIARGFQPYRPGEEVRHSLPPSYAMDPSYAAYSHLFPHHPFPHPAFRFDDPVMMDRYQQMMLPSAASYMPISHPGLMPHPSLQLIPGRYPPEVLHQQYPYLAGTRLPDSRSPLLSSERQRLEEERLKNIDREREKEREKEIEKLEREKIDRIRAQELEKRRLDGQMADRSYMEHNSHSNNGEHRSDRHERKSGHDDKHYRISATDFSVSKYGSITQGTSREQSNHPRQHNSQSTYSSRSDINRSDLRNKFPGSSSSHNKPVASVISNVAEKRRTSEEAVKAQPPPLVSPKKSTESLKPGGPESHLFRPFDTSKVLANGYDSKGDVSLYGKVSQAGLSHDSSQCNVLEKSNSVSNSSSNKQNDHSSPKDYTKSTLLSAESKKEQHSSDTAHKSLSDSSKSHSNNGVSKSTLDYEGLHPNFFRSGLIQNSLLFNLEHFPHITSKLDLEEKKLREARSSGNYDSEDDDSCVFDDIDENEKEKLTMIKSGPPLKLNSAPKKMEHLANLGLTTQNLEFEKLIKRKKRLKESDAIEVDADKKASPLNIPDASSTPEEEIDYEEKCKFLSMLGITVLKAEEKKELEEIRQVCEADRQRRYGPLNEDGSDKERKDSLHHRGTKRKFTEDDSSDFNVSLLDPLIQLKMAHSHKTFSNVLHSHSKSDPCAILFPERQRQLSREFAQEFHKSVLQSTRQKDSLTKAGICTTSSSDLPGIRNNDASTKISNEKLTSSIAGSVDSSETDSYKWPGIEAVLAAYQKHKEEESLEKTVLSGRCKKLSQENSELSQTASSLSRKLSELLEAKQNQETGRLQSKSAIDNLKRCLKQLR